MNIEKPEKDLLQEAGKSLAQPEKEMSDDERQAAQENSSRELFIQDLVMQSSLTAEQKLFVASFIQNERGPWRQYNGTTFKVVEAHVVGSVWKVSFGVYFDDYEAQRVDVDIPLSK